MAPNLHHHNPANCWAGVPFNPAEGFVFAYLSPAALGPAQNKKEIAYFVYAALPPDGYESLIAALGFTGIPFPDLRADIRIANLLVCPERVGWWVRRGEWGR